MVIVGGGPAGVAAGVYAARKRLKTLFVAEVVGGQSTDSVEIQNWIGTQKISGLSLAKELEEHLRAYAGDIVDIKIGERAELLDKRGDTFTVKTNKSTYEAHSILWAAGGTRKKLPAKGAAEFENKGVTYCASCDGPLFAGQDVAVVGGGNAGFETCAQLLAYCKSVTLIHRHENFDRADKSTVDAVLAHPNMRVIKNAEPAEVKGGQFVSSLIVKDRTTGQMQEIPTAAVFVEIGMVANTKPVKDLAALDEWGRVKVDGKSQRSSVGGLWAAGDCSDGLYHQNNIAAGDAVKALEDIYFWLKAGK